MSTDTRPSLGRHIDRVSVDISAECQSPYRPIVSTDTRSTDALSTHDPNTLSLTEELFIEVSWIQPLSVSDTHLINYTPALCKDVQHTCLPIPNAEHDLAKQRFPSTVYMWTSNGKIELLSSAFKRFSRWSQIVCIVLNTCRCFLSFLKRRRSEIRIRFCRSCLP